MLMRILKRNLQGKNHRKARNKPCQDRLLVQQGENTLLLVADGHGGTPYCRSGLGARLACKAAADILACSDEQDDIQTAAAIKEKFDRLVDKHLAFRPLSEEEKFLLQGRPAAVAYGTTLIAAAIRGANTTVYQIGDGGVYLLDEKGRFLPPLDDDSDCAGCVTSSIAYNMDRYLQHIRIRHYPGRPAAAMLFSDGYGFSSPLPWQAACALRCPDQLEEALDKLLQEGDHGDDQTFILAFDPDKIAAPDFLDGLDTEETKGRLAMQLAALQIELERRQCWLQLALQKARNLRKAPHQKEEFQRFKALIQERFEQYKELHKQAQQLWKEIDEPG